MRPAEPINDMGVEALHIQEGLPPIAEYSSTLAVLSVLSQTNTVVRTLQKAGNSKVNPL